MTTAPDTEVRVIVDLMLALNKLLDCCYQAEQAGSQCLSIAAVRRIAAGAVQIAQDSNGTTKLSRLFAVEEARRSAARGTP